jgi:hypothetical protein
MHDGHGGVVIGSEISGGARDIFVERCRMDSPRLDRVLRFKTNAERGGVIERVAMRDVTVGQVADAIVAADFYYEEGDTGAFTPVLRDVEVRNLTSRKSKHAFVLRGYERAPVSNIRVTDCAFDGVESPDVLQGVRDLTLTNVRVNGRMRNALWILAGAVAVVEGATTDEHPPAKPARKSRAREEKSAVAVAAPPTITANEPEATKPARKQKEEKRSSDAAKKTAKQSAPAPAEPALPPAHARTKHRDSSPDDNTAVQALAEARQREAQERSDAKKLARQKREDEREQRRLADLARDESSAQAKHGAKRRDKGARDAKSELELQRSEHAARWDALRIEINKVAGAGDTAAAPPLAVLEGVAGNPASTAPRTVPPPRMRFVPGRQVTGVRAPQALPEPREPAPVAPAPNATPPDWAAIPSGSAVRDSVPAAGAARLHTPAGARNAPTPRPAPTVSSTAAGSATRAATSPRIVPAPESQSRARSAPLVIRAGGGAAIGTTTPASGGETGTDSCTCRVQGTVEVDSDKPLPERLRVVVSLQWFPTVRDTVELFMGSPRPFTLARVPCGPQRLRVFTLSMARFDVASRDAVAGFRCESGVLQQPRIVLHPTR